MSPPLRHKRDRLSPGLRDLAPRSGLALTFGVAIARAGSSSAWSPCHSCPITRTASLLRSQAYASRRSLSAANSAPAMNQPSITSSARIIAIATGLLLLVPLFAMRFTSEVRWGPGDFVVAAILLFGAGMVYTLAARLASSKFSRLLIGLLVLVALLTVWAELAVGLFS